MVWSMRLILCSFVLLSACASFPQLEGTISDAARAAPYPPLTQLPTIPPARGAEADDLQDRIAALLERAAQIRQIDMAALQ